MNDLEMQFDELVAREPGGDAGSVLAGATRALARRDRRRRAVLAGGVGLVVAAAVLVAVRVGQNDDPAPVVDETTTTTSWPCCRVRITRAATAFSFWTSATLLPPYFWTMTGMRTRILLGLVGGWLVGSP